MTSFTANNNFTFQLEGTTIHASNLVFDQFTHTIPAHSHGANCYEIHYIPAGYGKLHANNIDYDITPNTLYVTGPFIEHSQAPLPENPMQEYCVYFRLPKALPSSTKAPILNAFAETNFWFGQDTQNVSFVFRTLFTELMHQPIAYEIHAELLLAQIMILLVRNYRKTTVLSPSQTSTNTNENMTLLIEEYFLYEYQSLSLEGLATRLNLSHRQTQRLLLQYYGKTFQQKKTAAKMSAAAILLHDKEKSITTISDMLGYSSPEYFSSAFKAYYHVSPRDYRKTISS